jgi:hypothetical protein
MTLLFKIKAVVWPIVVMLVLLMSFSLVGLCLSDKDGNSVALSQSACDSVVSIDKELQEESTDYMADSVEFSGCISKSKGKIKALHKVLDLYRSQYKPPFMEKEQRPPQHLSLV